MKTKLKVKLLSSHATAPMRMSNRAAGFDLFCSEDVMMLPGQIVHVKTGVAIELPESDDPEWEYEAEIRGRSGLAFGKKIMCAHVGTVDGDYRGEIRVLLVNASSAAYKIRAGERCGQMILKKVWIPSELELVGELSETERGEKGYGSTGN